VSEHALHAKNMGSRKRFPSDPVVDVTQKKNMFLYPTMTKPFRTGPLMPLIQQVLSWASIFPGTLHHRDALNPELGNRHSGSLKKNRVWTTRNSFSQLLRDCEFSKGGKLCSKYTHACRDIFRM